MLSLWLALLVFVAVNRQDVIDLWRLRQYQAPAAVSQLATQGTMTDFGRKVFYVNEPNIQDKTSFAKECLSSDGKQEQTIVLGCYHSNQAGIFLMKVTDPRLDGVEQVTAAHEMLHAAYDRLSRSDKSKVDAMLTKYYKQDLRDERILKTIDAYKKTEPNDLVNEMHSIFGTEIASLPADLEAYYKRYFTNRSQVVAFAAQYQAEFTSRKQIVAEADARLDVLRQQIEGLESSLRSRQAAIDEQRASLNALKASGDFRSYNAEVSSYNALVNDYNADVASLRSLIEEHNALVATRNAVALEVNQLSKELSNDTTTISQ
ncbi:MAG: hypothetical protein AAB462_02930 [Patescibacteria group bacterium]